MIPKNKNIESKKKWIISFWAVLVFLIVSLPYTYKLTNMFTADFGFPTFESNCPTPFGIALHTIVFLLLTRRMMDFKLPGI